MTNKNYLDYYAYKSQNGEQIKFVSGDGAALTDERGCTYIDLDEIINILGQNNQEFNNRIMSVLTGPDMAKGGVHPQKEALIQSLLEITEDKFNKMFFASSASESVESAIKLAKKATGRTEILCFWNSVHGRTYVSSSVSGKKNRKNGYGPLAAGVVYSPYPKCICCIHNLCSENCGFKCIEHLDRIVDNESADDIAALIIEPIQTFEGNCPPEGYLKRLFEWAKAKDILVIFDEVQSGIGRTGKMFRYMHEEITPDILLTGKGLGNGIHISALLFNEGIVPEKDLRILAGGSGDNEVSCAAAAAVLSYVKKPETIERIAKIGQMLKTAVNGVKEKYGFIEQVRGDGLMIAIEFTTEEICNKILQVLIDNKFIIMAVNKTLIFKPPLVLTEVQAQSFISTLLKSFDEVSL